MSRRVYEIAKELGLSSSEVIAALGGLGVVAKSHSSTVEDAIFDKLKEASDNGTIKKLAAAKQTARPQRPQRPPRPPAERSAAERPPAERAPRPAAERPPAERAPAPAPARPAAERPPQRPAAQAPRQDRSRRAAAPVPQAPAPAAPAPAAAAASADGMTTATVELKPLTISRGITVQEFAAKLGVKAAEIVSKLFRLGEMYTIAQSLSDEAAELMGMEYGYAVNIIAPGQEDAIEEDDVEEDPAVLRPRPPVITVMGHVDHGKTLLLDKIREANVVAQEHGGITQHIGAYQVEKNSRAITFIDTPGHEAFTQMRARGAAATDIAVLVVAADDGVKPQTVEALSHAKAAEVPVVVAVNKIDKPEADPARVRQQLSEHGLVPEEWGGDTPFVDISAKTGDHIADLLDVLLLVADIKELKANHDTPARGVVIEAHLDKGRGPVATVLVQRGTLRVGDILVCGTAWARVRAMLDDIGNKITEAGPGSPAQVLGFNTVPDAGDEFRNVGDERRARQTAQDRETRRRAAEVVARRRVTLEDIFEQAQAGEVIELNIVLKADVQGSLEAVTDALEKLQMENASVRVLHRAVGAITENDVSLAQASNAIIVGFNVRPSPTARAQAEANIVDIRSYQIIYKLVEDIEGALKGMLKPIQEERVLGRAEVRAVFKGSKIGTVAGTHVDEGQIVRGAKARLLRESVVIADTVVSSLFRFKDAVREVQAGYECGIGLEGYGDVKEGDVIEVYEIREVART